MSGRVELEHEVRERLRNLDVDPVNEPDQVRRVIGEVLATHTRFDPDLDEDVSATVRSVVDAVSGFGPLQPYLDDPQVEEIWLNEPSKVFVARAGVAELTPTLLEESEVRAVVERMLRSSGRRLDLSVPFCDASLPDGSRLHVVIPDVTRRHWAINIRKFVMASHGLDDLVARGSMTPQLARVLTVCVRAGLNIVVSGATQAGKTTLLNCLTAAIPPTQRIVTCEEVFELQVSSRDWVAMQCRQPNLEGTGEITLRMLVKEALRMRPDRLIVGEVRQAESLDLLLALNSGLPGLATLHANSAREAVAKLCTLPLLAGGNIVSTFITPTVAAVVDLVVHLGLDARGHRIVQEVIRVPGQVENGLVQTSPLYGAGVSMPQRLLSAFDGETRFERAGIDLRDLVREMTAS